MRPMHLLLLTWAVWQPTMAEPADRWVAASRFLLRTAPRADAPVVARLALNTRLRQTGDDVGNGYCAVQQREGDLAAGYAACRYLQPAPLDLKRISEPLLTDGCKNPDFDPARTLWIAPNTMCEGWVAGFASEGADAATYRRNGVTRRPAPGPIVLFTFWSARALPAAPSRWTRQVFALDRAATGFASGEWRTVDIDGDGVADLAWLQATGRGPGHTGDAPTHDDPWYRLLLANVAGRWRLLAAAQFSYGCGC